MCRFSDLKEESLKSNKFDIEALVEKLSIYIAYDKINM